MLMLQSRRPQRNRSMRWLFPKGTTAARELRRAGFPERPRVLPKNETSERAHLPAAALNRHYQPRRRRPFISGALTPGRYSLTLGPGQHCVEAIDGTPNIVGLGYTVEKIGGSEHILSHEVQQRFKMSRRRSFRRPRGRPSRWSSPTS